MLNNNNEEFYEDYEEYEDFDEYEDARWDYRREAYLSCVSAWRQYGYNSEV